MAMENVLALQGGARSNGAAAYRIAFPNRDHHEAEVIARFDQLAAGGLTLRMARSSPGRYALHEFARHISRVSAHNGAGAPLVIERPDEHTWRIPDHDGTVLFRYTVFGDHADGTCNGIDNTHAHLQMPATLVYSPAHQRGPHTIAFELPTGAGWRIATALAATQEPNVFAAPDLHTLFDSPVELSNHARRDCDGFSVVVHHTGSEAEVDALLEPLQRIMQQHEAVFGERPAFTNGAYLFMIDALPWVFDDAMEHRDCCVITFPGTLKDASGQILAKASHEYFHAWSMERLRPRSLEPFDYTRANASPELWFAEGFATYYGTLALARAGLISTVQYARILSSLLNDVVNSPARLHRSVVEMSMHAPFTDAAVFVDAPVSPNLHTPYEAWGACIALALDLTLRAEYQTSLDILLQRLWAQFGRPEIPYTNRDLEATLAGVTQDSAFAHAFFAQFVYGTALPDYTRLLDRAGLIVRASAPALPTLGLFWGGVQNGALTIGSHTQAGSPLYEAGIDRGDQLLALDGTGITGPADLQNLIARKMAGDTVAVTYRKRGELRTRSVVLAGSPALEVIPCEVLGRSPTAAALKLRNEWLSAR